MKIKKADIKDILAATFPDYSGRKFRAECVQSIWVDRIGGGGSRDDIKVAIHDGNTWKAAAPVASRMEAPCGDLALRLDAVYVMHSYFCGTDAGITVYYHPDSEYAPAPMLTA